MLVLLRKPGQGFRIGDNCHVMVLSINGNAVRIGVDAPQNVIILRDELGQHRIEPCGAVAPALCQGCYQDPCICLADTEPIEWHRP